jgi:hypothetical protein
MPVNRNIGKMQNIFDNALKVPDLINYEPEPDPYQQFTDYNDLRCSQCDDRHANGFYIWGLHKWGSAGNRVKS